MPLFLTRDQRADSGSSGESSIIRSSTSSLQTWYRKRKRNSPSPSPPLRQDSITSESASTDSSRASTRSRDQSVNGSRWSQQSPHASIASPPFPAQDSGAVSQQPCVWQGYTTLPTDQNRRLGQLEQNSGFVSSCRPTLPGRRRSSARLREILPPQDFTVEELAEALELSQPSCRFFVGRVYRPHPEPGWRVETKARSPESCFTTTSPIYSVRRHSPLLTGRPFTIYFESDIRPGNSEDGVCFALGFVAGRDRASLMPGSERGSIGIHYRGGSLYMNNKLLARAVFKPGQQVGIGMNFSKSDFNAQEVRDAQSSAISSSSVNVEVFLSRDEKKVAGWNLSELRDAGSLPFEGLEGNHDLYAAVGTLKEVNVDILFDKRDWRYYPEAG
jgi:hypothetical protein